ncbi:MAG: hypothetical protein ABIF12_02665 [bacterium]
MNFIQKNMSKAIDFGFSLVPVLILVFTFKITKNLKLAFYLASPLAIGSLIKAFLDKKRELFMLAVNCFLAIGLFMYFFDFLWLQTLYQEFLYSMIFVWVFIISFILTFFTKEKISNVETQDKKMIFNYSLYFLMATVIALGLSFYFKGNYFLGAWLPFVLLVILKDFFYTFIKGISYGKYYMLGAKLGLILISALLKKYIFVSLIFLMVGRKILHNYFEQKFGLEK